MKEPTGRYMIMIAGPVRAGKSTFAGNIVKRFGGMRVSFGDAVRRRTRALGLPDDRNGWQQVGEEWVTQDPEGLCDAVMTPSAGEALVVVDGVRHRRIYNLLRARAQDQRVLLVFVDADEQTRRSRLALDGIDDGAIEHILTHSTEQELPWLRDSADIVIDGTRDASQVLSDLEAWITSYETDNGG
jgi:dephospho-CoA kinase